MNDKVFVKESYKILKGTAVFKDGSIDEIKNVQVYSKIDVDPWVEELQAEIERLMKIVRRHKYKRCLAMALLALEKRETCKVEYEEWCLKWYKRWLNLAKKYSKEK